jgi:hypothetical protein
MSTHTALRISGDREPVSRLGVPDLLHVEARQGAQPRDQPRPIREHAQPPLPGAVLVAERLWLAGRG